MSTEKLTHLKLKPLLGKLSVRPGDAFGLFDRKRVTGRAAAIISQKPGSRSGWIEEIMAE